MATATAIQSVAVNGSVFVFKMPIGSVNCFGRPFFRGYAEFLAGPFAEIEQLAAFAAEGAIRIVFVFDFFFTSGTFHG